MPIQSPQWTDFLTCSVCYHEYDSERVPISLACSHTVCKLCLSKLNRKQCPFDQTKIRNDIENLPVNYALLRLVSYGTQCETNKLLQQQISYANVVGLAHDDLSYYVQSVQYVEEIALFLKRCSLGAANPLRNANILSRPMQKKIITLLNCQLLEREGQVRALRAARSIGERTITELLIHHQNPQQLSSNLWAAIRNRGCQFLGPAMQEEVLKLVLLALEDGSAISRKVLVMFIVQRLEPHFPQASKTSIGHVVQLLYRASCFVVSKRESDSSLMELKVEFRSYDSLRREHDTQIVEIALEAGLRIAPDQWSALLYGDTTHKSHMQSIIDKLQTPESFAQSVQELTIVLQRSGDPDNLFSMKQYLEYLADIDLTNENDLCTWKNICKALEAADFVVAGLVKFISTNGGRKINMADNNNAPVVQNSHGAKYKTSLCRAYAAKGRCPRGTDCTFAHSEEELIKHRVKNTKSTSAVVGLNRDTAPKKSLHILPISNGIANADNCVPVYKSKSKSNHHENHESVSGWIKYDLQNSATPSLSTDEIASNSNFRRSEVTSSGIDSNLNRAENSSSLLDKSQLAAIGNYKTTYYTISEDSFHPVTEEQAVTSSFDEQHSASKLDRTFMVDPPLDDPVFRPIDNISYRNTSRSSNLAMNSEVNSFPTLPSSISPALFSTPHTSSMLLTSNISEGSYNPALSSSSAMLLQSANYSDQIKPCPKPSSNMYVLSAKTTPSMDDEIYNELSIVHDMKKLELRLGHELEE